MSDFYVDYGPAHQRLRAAIANTEEHLQAHESSQPAFPASSAGQGFTGHGVAIQALLETMHQRTRWRLHNALNTFDATANQVTQFQHQDDANAAHLGTIMRDGARR